jgi:hypothetical protein
MHIRIGNMTQTVTFALGIVVVVSATVITIKMLNVIMHLSQIEEMHLMLSQIHTGQMVRNIIEEGILMMIM